MYPVKIFTISDAIKATNPNNLDRFLRDLRAMMEACHITLAADGAVKFGPMEWTDDGDPGGCIKLGEDKLNFEPKNIGMHNHDDFLPFLQKTETKEKDPAESVIELFMYVPEDQQIPLLGKLKATILEVRQQKMKAAQERLKQAEASLEEVTGPKVSYAHEPS